MRRLYTLTYVTLHERCNLLHIARVQQIYDHAHTPTHICLSLFICMSLGICVYIYTYVCLLCMYVYIYICTYILLQRIYDPEKECLATLKPIPLDNTMDMPFIGGDLPPGNNSKNSHHLLPPSLFLSFLSLSLSRSHRSTRPWTCP